MAFGNRHNNKDITDRIHIISNVKTKADNENSDIEHIDNLNNQAARRELQPRTQESGRAVRGEAAEQWLPYACTEKSLQQISKHISTICIHHIYV